MKKLAIFTLALTVLPFFAWAASQAPEAVAPEASLVELVGAEAPVTTADAPAAIFSEGELTLEDLFAEPARAACLDSGVSCSEIDCSCARCVCAGTCLYCP